MLTLDRISVADIPNVLPGARPERLLFHTPEWFRFLAETQRAEPVIARVSSDGETVGHFFGGLVRRFGLPILGSPFPGWTTSYMGFDLDEGVDRREALEALRRFAFDDIGCLHLEMRDRSLTSDPGLEWARTRRSPVFEVDLSGDEDEIFSRFKSECRTCIRKAERSGLTIEVAEDDAFADEYFSQLEEVFARQGKRPTYDKARVRALMKAALPSGHLLALRARDPEGLCVATAIFPAMDRVMYFWGGASRQAHRSLRPNEALFWFAMRHWKARGVMTFDMGGGGDYKRKYGPNESAIMEIVASRYSAITGMRDAARTAYSLAARTGRSVRLRLRR